MRWLLNVMNAFLMMGDLEEGSPEQIGTEQREARTQLFAQDRTLSRSITSPIKVPRISWNFSSGCSSMSLGAAPDCPWGISKKATPLILATP
ncbi:MAG: hypothetical protein M3P18_22165 [Actinomycetota bacterium]|nr:hypothetical protein [Actinomycetota bacterium]